MGENNVTRKYIKTSMGIIPLEDYLDIIAIENGFSDYEELRREGYNIEISDSDIIDE